MPKFLLELEASSLGKLGITELVGELKAECGDSRTWMLEEGPLVVGTTERMCNPWGESGMKNMRKREKGGQGEKGESS